MAAADSTDISAVICGDLAWNIQWTVTVAILYCGHVLWIVTLQDGNHAKKNLHMSV